MGLKAACRRHVNRFQCQELVFCENNRRDYVIAAVLPFDAISLQATWIKNIQQKYNYAESFDYKPGIVDRTKFP